MTAIQQILAGSVPNITLSISPNLGHGASGSATFYTFGFSTVSVNGGTPSSYNWRFAGATGGTFSVASGQGTASGRAFVSGVLDTASADFVCDVVVNGQTYTISHIISYNRFF